jgi:hypothetical protein
VLFIKPTHAIQKKEFEFSKGKSKVVHVYVRDVSGRMEVELHPT